MIRGLVPLVDEDPCCGCGWPVSQGEAYADGSVQGWCDLCFQRLIVQWRRSVLREWLAG